MAKKVLILTGDGAEGAGIMYPQWRMEEAGFEVEIGALAKRKIHTVVHDFADGWDTYTEKPGYEIQATIALADVKPEDYVGLMLPGGRAPEYLASKPEAEKIVRHFFEKGKPVCVNCHGGLIPLALGLLKGRTLTCYPALQGHFRNGGAEWVDKPNTDKNLVSSRGRRDHVAMMKDFMKILGNA